MDVLALLERLARLRQDPLWNPKMAAFAAATGESGSGTGSWTSYYRPIPAVPVRDWPLAADFDGDSRAEVVVPHHDFPPRNIGRYGGVRMLDGLTGETRWDCPLWPDGHYAYDGLVHMLAGPDLDADGTADLVVVSRFGSGRYRNEAFAAQAAEPSRAYVDAISGKDGRKLWHWRTELTNADSTPIGSAFWWGIGSDGWPMLALPIRWKTGAWRRPRRFYRFYPPDPPVVHLVAAATGIEEHIVPGLTSLKVGDLTGDGLDDLWGAVDGKLGGDPCKSRPRHGVRSVGSSPPATLTATASATWSVTTSRHRKSVAIQSPTAGRPSPGRVATAGSCGRRCLIPGRTGFPGENGQGLTVSNL